MSRGTWRDGLFVLCVICSVDIGCGSSAQAPIPDPGGPFHTDVPPTTILSSLTDAQLQELCTEFKAADQAYLTDAISGETGCRLTALEAGGSPVNQAQDGSADGGSFSSACQAAYDSCKQQLSSSPPACRVPVSGCGATVELLSACLNEIANTNPVATCVSVPTCAAAAAAGSTSFDAGSYCLVVGGGPSLPACDRLSRQCPNSAILDPY